MKKSMAVLLLAVIVLAVPLYAYAAYSDSDSTSGTGDSAIWHYGYNSLGTVAVSGTRWQIPYSASTTALSNYLEVAGTMTLIGSSNQVILNTSSSGYGAPITSGTKYYTKSSSYNDVSFAASHDGYLSDDKIVHDWHSSTYTYCDLPSAKSALPSEDVYNRSVENDYNLANESGVELIGFSHCNMLDWSKFHEAIPQLRDNQAALDGFERLVMYEVYGNYVVVGDTAPSFWFNEKADEVLILFSKKDGRVIVLSSQLVGLVDRDRRTVEWSTPLLLSTVSSIREPFSDEVK